MQRHYACGQVEVLAALEPDALHHALQRFLVGMAADRLGEIAVALGITGEPTPKPRQHLKRVELIERRERPEMRVRELEDEQPAAGLQDAVEARERAFLVRDVA